MPSPTQLCIEKAKPVRLLILDVDGILTTGKLFYSAQHQEIKDFHVRDGMGIKLLQQTGVSVAVISGRTSEAVKKRMQELDIEYIFLGDDKKLPLYEQLKQQLGLEDKEIACMGDDLPDLPMLRRAGLALTVPQAPDIIQQYADLVTKTAAGEGAVREACELIMHAQATYPAVLQPYLSE